MYKQAFMALAVGIVLALGSASCGPTCPAGQQSCGTANASAGGASDAGTATCELLTATQKCMKAYCATASNPFCKCYKLGFDIDIASCKCIDFDTEEFCEQAKQNGADATSYDCAAASSGVSSICVGVN